MQANIVSYACGCLPATLRYMCVYYTLYFQCVQVYYYKIPTNVELVTVEASSETYGCTIVSIQNNTVSMFLVTYNYMQH